MEDDGGSQNHSKLAGINRETTGLGYLHFRKFPEQSSLDKYTKNLVGSRESPPNIAASHWILPRFRRFQKPIFYVPSGNWTWKKVMLNFQSTGRAVFHCEVFNHQRFIFPRFQMGRSPPKKTLQAMCRQLGLGSQDSQGGKKWIYPLVNIQKTMERSTIFNG